MRCSRYGRLASIVVAALLAATATVFLWPRFAGPSGSAGADSVTVLRVANWGGPAVDPSFMKIEHEVLAEFERRHPGVTVRVENIPGPGQYVPKLLMTYVAGNPPDVMTLDASSAAVFIDNGLLANLMPTIRGDAAFRLDDFFPNVVDIARQGDRLYAIPSDFTPMVIVYNKRVFDEARRPYPRPGWTRSEFLETAQALTVRGEGRAAPARYGFNFQKEMPLWFPWIWAGGSDVLSPDGRHAVGYLDAPATVETIGFLADLVRTHRVAPSLSESAAAGVDLFRTGRAAMTMTGHWSLIEYRVDKMDIGVAAVPTSGGGRVTVMYEAGLAISAASPHKEAAWEYIKYRVSTEVQKKVLAAGLAISANQGVARSFAGDPVEDAFLEEVPYARRPWGARVERYELVEDLGREMMEDILTGGVPARDAAARTARLIEAELERQ
jgi:multiple sugar transport system substrate-binding protein